MIARIWRGVVQLDDADEYADYIRDTGFTGRAASSSSGGSASGWTWLHPRDYSMARRSRSSRVSQARRVRRAGSA